MSLGEEASAILEVKVADVFVSNPRKRQQREFAELVESISSIGLKRPITVCVEGKSGQGNRYNLVCGEGRLEAFKLLGQSTIPAVVIDVPEDERFLRGLVENIARRAIQPHELLRDILQLRKRGHSASEIAKMTGLSAEYVRGVQKLLQNGENTLIDAVYKGRLPVSVAIEIARNKDSDTQIALANAYESGSLTGAELRTAKQLIVERSMRSAPGKGAWRANREKLTTDVMIKFFKEEADRQKHLVAKAELAKDRLEFLVAGLRMLFKDDGFLKALRREGINEIPAPLAKLLNPRSGGI